jgi:anti-anti-sigma factor
VEYFVSQSQSLQIKSEQAGDVAVVQCRGRIVRGTLHILYDAVISLPPKRVIVLDLSGVQTLDCGGLGALVFLHCWTRNNDTQLKLVNPSNFAREMFERTGLTCVLHIPSVDDAVDILCTLDNRTENVYRVVN